MRPNTAIARALLVPLALAALALRGADAFSWDAVTFSGFFSQGYLYSSDVNYPTADRGGTWDFREMAVNASTALGDHWRIGAQGFAEQFGNLGDDRVILDWAVLDYNFNQQFGLRVGRVKYPKGLYGEALDLDSVRPFVLLPTAVYNPVLRDFAASFDGAMAYGTIDAGASAFDYKLFYGDIPMSPEQGVAEYYNNSGLYAPSGVTAMAMRYVAGSQLVWNTPIPGLRFAHSYSFYHDLSSDGPFAEAPVLNLHTNIGRFYWSTLSAEYLVGPWTFASEWQRAGGNGAVASAAPAVPYLGLNVGWDAWYVSAARRFLKKFEAGAYVSSIHDRFPSGAGSLPANYRHDAVASLRYDFSDHLLFKVEVQSVQGLYQTFDTERIPNPPAATPDHTTVLAAKTTLSF